MCDGNGRKENLRNEFAKDAKYDLLTASYALTVDVRACTAQAVELFS